MTIPKEKHVLLIDDQLEFCTLVQDILNDSICDLRYFTNAREGLREALTRRDLDLILLDIDMPEITGLEILRQLKKSHARKTPVMMFTAHAEMDVVHEAFESGANSYMIKPFRVYDFIAHINQALHIDVFYHRVQGGLAAVDEGQAIVPLDEDMHSVATRRILMVDDLERDLTLVADILADSSCHMIGTQDPAEGLQLAESQKLDLILLDLHMPEMSGVEFLHALREKGLKTRVMILSSDNSVDAVSATKNYDIEGFILKPFKLHFFVRQLEQALGTKLFAGKFE